LLTVYFKASFLLTELKWLEIQIEKIKYEIMQLKEKQTD